MDLQKEREAFEAWFSQEFRCDEWEYNPFSRMEFNGIEAYSCSTVNTVWLAWQAAKAQAVPKGFVLVPKEPTSKILQAMKKANDNGIHATQIYRCGLQYKAMIEAQEQSHD